MKKILSLLMLLVAIVTGAWADTDPTLDVEFTSTTKADWLKSWTTEGITLSGDGGFSSSSGVYYSGCSSNASTVSGKYFGIATNSDTKKIVKVSIKVSPNNSNHAYPVFVGWSETPALKNVACYKAIEGTSTSNTKANAEWITYDLEAEGVTGDIHQINIYRKVSAGYFYESETAAKSIGDGKDLGAGVTLRIWEVKVWLEDTRTVDSEAYAGVKKGDATLTENTDFTKVENVITLASSYKTMTAPTDIKLINHITYTDESTKDEDVDVTFASAASDGYFVGTATIALTTYTVKVPEDVPTSAPTITTDLEAAYDVIKGKTLELSIVAEAAASYQWYLDGVAVEGATTDTYTFTAGSTIGATNAVYCAAINAAGTTNSVTATITTVGRADCELTNIKFSNGAYGAINNATYGDGTIAVPYIAGTSAPTVEEASINISDGATYVLDGNTLTVTAENGTDKKDYTVQAVEMTPLEVDEDVETTAFTAVPTWAFNLYGFDAEKGVKFAKKVDESSNMRVAKGNTRLYMFISKAKSITLTSGTGGARNIKVYRNGEQLETPTATADKDKTITIALDENATNMVLIESNQTGGDGGFTKYAIEKATPTINVVLGANGYSTFRPGLNVKLASGATVYTAKIQDGAVVLSEVAADAVIGYDEGVILKGTEGETAVFTVVEDEATELDNDLIGANALTNFDDYTYPYVLASNGTKTSFVKLTSDYYDEMFGKAFIVYAGMQEGSLDIQFEGEATAINNVNANDNANSDAPVKVIKNGKLFIGNYNVAGQLVK